MNEPTVKDIGMLEHIRSSFLDALAQVTNTFPDRESQAKIIGFILMITSQYNMQAAFTSQGIQRLSKLVMEEQFHRDFVFRMISSFMTRFGSDKENYKYLIENLTTAMNVAGSDPANSTIPTELQDRLPDAELIRVTLNANPWMVILVMLSLYAQTDLPTAFAR
jgi:hypothetical protein